MQAALTWNEAQARTVIDRHVGRPGALLPMLHDLQQHFGHIPAEAVPVLADVLNRSRAEIHGVVTFYHDFRRSPPGRHVVKLCQAEACQAMGARDLARQAQAHLGLRFGATGADGAVTLEPVYCLGLCATAPAAMVDGRVIGRLTPAQLEETLAGLS